MTEAEKQHPEILEQPVEAPIFITGMGRTGTSILLELMAQDPQVRTPAGWELRYPSPPPQAGQPDSARLDATRAEIDMWL
jgi:Sulfotransferase family